MSRVPLPAGLAPVALARREPLLRAVADGRRLGLQLGAGVVDSGAKMKAEGASWMGPRRMWVLPDGPREKLAARLRRQLADQTSTLNLDGIELVLGTKAVQADYFTQLLDVQVFPLAEGRGSAVSFVYDAWMVEAMRALRGRFHKPAKAWEVSAPRERVLEVIYELAGVRAEYIFFHERPVSWEQLSAAGSSPVPISVPAAAATLPSGSTTEGEGGSVLAVHVDERGELPVAEDLLRVEAQRAGLRSYQVEGARHLLRYTSALLGDDMGLGKSRQTVVAARLAAGTRRVLIVCPASLRINWEREIRAVYPEARIGMVGEDRLSTLYACEWIIANYERLGGLVRETALQIEVLGVDEAHNLKQLESGRTRNAFLIAARVPRRFLITGTPLLNREVELHTLLKLSGHPIGHLDLKGFRARYAGGPAQRAALAEALRGWMLRRRKDVLTDLGAKHRQVRYISPSEGRAAYDQVMADMSLTTMPKIVKLRQALEAMKIEFIVETVQGLGADDKIIIFAEYMDSVAAIREACDATGVGVVSLVGADPGTKRQAAIDAFQNDSSVRVFIGTTSAAGVGITLTAANYVVFASLPWTPAMMRQAEDRAYRLGQKRDVYVIVPLVPKTIDEQIHQLLASKTEIEEDVVEAVRTAVLAEAA